MTFLLLCFQRSLLCWQTHLPAAASLFGTRDCLLYKTSSPHLIIEGSPLNCYHSFVHFPLLTPSCSISSPSVPSTKGTYCLFYTLHLAYERTSSLDIIGRHGHCIDQASRRGQRSDIAGSWVPVPNKVYLAARPPSIERIGQHSVAARATLRSWRTVVLL